MKPIELYFDGSCIVPYDGPASYGFTIREIDPPADVAEGCGLVLPRSGVPITNNVAEWFALEMGLTWLADNPRKASGLQIRGDSDLVIKQLNGRWKCKKPWLRDARNRCLAILNYLIARDRLQDWEANWIPREKNFECDALAESAYSAL